MKQNKRTQQAQDMLLLLKAMQKRNLERMNKPATDHHNGVRIWE